MRVVIIELTRCAARGTPGRPRLTARAELHGIDDTKPKKVLEAVTELDELLRASLGQPSRGFERLVELDRRWGALQRRADGLRTGLDAFKRLTELSPRAATAHLETLHERRSAILAELAELDATEHDPEVVRSRQELRRRRPESSLPLRLVDLPPVDQAGAAPPPSDAAPAEDADDIPF